MRKRLAAAALACALTLMSAPTVFAETHYLDGTSCIFDFSQVIDEETVIHCDDNVKLTFSGHYGTDRENLRVWTAPLEYVTEALEDEDIDFYIFGALPKFARPVKVSIRAGEGTFLYEYTLDGELRLVDAVHENGEWIFETRVLGAYLITEEEYPEGPLGSEPAAETASSADGAN